ncbi:MAG: glycoside hydrolase family 2 protein, partial [Spirochaetales bacterium]|nr:glycoside hydrolase family 2 protein [Candidatus Physcosoma equi]
MERINDNWYFSPSWEDTKEEVLVRLPHNPKEIPLHYGDKSLYEMISSYRRTLVLTEEDEKKRLFLKFDGAAHIATVFVNGKELCTHRCGYTAFRVEFTSVAKVGDNSIAVRLDSTENPTIPPFGFVMDYLTYSGLYR